VCLVRVREFVLVNVRVAEKFVPIHGVFMLCPWMYITNVCVVHKTPTPYMLG